MAKDSSTPSRRTLAPVVIPVLTHAFITRYRCDYRVLSPAVVNGRGKYFRIKNLTKASAIVTLPAQLVGKRVAGYEIPAGGTESIRLNPGSGGAYTYSVIMRGEEGLETAHGNSDPVIIIDPPCP